MERRSWWHALSVALTLTVFSSASPAFSQAPAARTEPDVPEKKGKDLRAFPVGDKAPRIDGRLDDEIWTTADRIEDMVQNDPDKRAQDLLDEIRRRSGEAQRPTEELDYLKRLLDLF